MFQNDRTHNRYPLFARAQIVVKNETNPVEIKTEVSSIAVSGLGVYSAEPIELGSEVSINIEFLSGKGEMMNDTIEGKVVWVSITDDIYFLGIFFDEDLNKDKQPNLYRRFHRIIEDD